MKEFNFNSQVCTDKNQSERLLALGLKKETADMYLQSTLNDVWSPYIPIAMPYSKVEAYNLSKDVFRTIPAWSLHRLISLTNTDNIKIACNEKHCWGGNVLKITQRKAFEKGNLYDNTIDCIEWLIKEGYFNKEYLENGNC